MAGLFHTLNIGSESLFASRQGVDTAGHNIANAHTEGYSRQRVNLEQREPSARRGVIIGNGVFVKNINRAHDQFLERQINQVNQDFGKSESKYDAMKPIEEIYSPELNSSVSDEINNFFNSMQDLANFPEEMTVRSSVRENAQNLVNSFHRNDRSLKNYREDLNQRVSGEVGNANTLINEIARLNIAIRSMNTPGDKEASDLLDQQDLLLRKLTEVMDINYYRSEMGMVVVRGPQETLLVEKGFAANLSLKLNTSNSNMYDILVDNGASHNPTVVTHANRRGRLAGLIEVRDEVIPGLVAKNNEMAYEFANRFNEIHRNGYGLQSFKESLGRDFFEVSSDQSLAAETIQVHSLVNEDLNSISVASTPFAPGDNVIANELLRLKERPVMSNGDESFNDFYANYVGVFGLELVRAEHTKKANTTLIDDLRGRREAVAGVSMDEEAMNLLKWQANFTASSKVITTIDEMLETVLAMKR
ncbi:MAG: flagellar hook-associated protein FlgK [Oligoflexus sp.]